jgi:hypothetical protein
MRHWSSTFAMGHRGFDEQINWERVPKFKIFMAENTIQVAFDRVFELQNFKI